MTAGVTGVKRTQRGLLLEGGTCLAVLLESLWGTQSLWGTLGKHGAGDGTEKLDQGPGPAEALNADGLLHFLKERLFRFFFLQKIYIVMSKRFMT